MSSFEAIVRKFIPSVASLTFNPAGRLMLNAADLFPNATFSAFRRLPPNALRARVGVGNQIFFNQPQFFYSAHFWMLAFSKGWASLGSNIVDLGCGCGRYAHHLRDLSLVGERYAGRYYGVDIDAEAISWCQRNFDERFAFFVSTDKSTTYNKADGGDQGYRLDIESDHIDLIFSTSLFTHLLENELKNYLAESFRVLRSGGTAVHSIFLYDFDGMPTRGGRHTFEHRRGEAYIQSLASPEAAVAYTSDYFHDQAKAAGFAQSEILKADGVIQPFLVCKKA